MCTHRNHSIHICWLMRQVLEFVLPQPSALNVQAPLPYGIIHLSQSDCYHRLTSDPGIEGLAWNDELTSPIPPSGIGKLRHWSQLAKGRETRTCYLSKLEPSWERDNSVDKWREAGISVQGNPNTSIEGYLSSSPVLLPWGPPRPYLPFLEYCDVSFSKYSPILLIEVEMFSEVSLCFYWLSNIPLSF